MNKRQELEQMRTLRGKIIGVLNGSVAAAEIESFNYGEADGSQSVRRRSPKELMALLDGVDKKIAALERDLQGGGIMTFGTNRYAI